MSAPRASHTSFRIGCHVDLEQEEERWSERGRMASEDREGLGCADAVGRRKAGFLDGPTKCLITPKTQEAKRKGRRLVEVVEHVHENSVEDCHREHLQRDADCLLLRRDRGILGVLDRLQHVGYQLAVGSIKKRQPQATERMEEKPG
eukprot:2055968-Rhodomonas_salina.1